MTDSPGTEWLRRADWCSHHRQPLYVTRDDWSELVDLWNAALDRDDREQAELAETIRLAAGSVRFPPEGWDDPPPDRRPRLDPTEIPQGTQLAGVVVLLDPPKAERQRRLFKAGTPVAPCHGGPLDGEVAQAHDASRLTGPPGWDGYYGAVRHGTHTVAWLWRSNEVADLDR